MPTFVRRNQLIIKGRFWAPETSAVEAAEALAGTEGDPVLDTDVPIQPSSATALFNYENQFDVKVSTTINLTLDVTDPNNPFWSGTWDSTDAKAGRVEWCVFSAGAVVAAAEGWFTLEANDANMVDLTDEDETVNG